MFSIKRIEGGTIITVLGLKIKLTRGLRLEQDNGGPYGMYDLIKMRAGVPFCVKSVVCQHGWNPLDHAGLSDLSVVKTLMLCWNARYQKACNESSNVPSAIVGAPFVHYRRMRNITLTPDARGTIAFPAHAIRVSRPQFDIEQYCQTLRALPEQYQPVTICLHPGDIIYHGLDAVYNKLGMKTVCAGLDDGEPFYSKFYRLLARHRYVTSNAPGSYSFYAIEMGIPFFILGEFPVEDNSGGVDTDMPKELLRVENHPALKKAYDLFTTERHDVITEEQRAPTGPNEQWAMDFVSDSLESSRRMKVLTIIDLWDRRSLWLEADSSIPGDCVVRVLEQLRLRGECPKNTCAATTDRSSWARPWISGRPAPGCNWSSSGPAGRWKTGTWRASMASFARSA